eukprot:6472982-Ditylum_brightwellii.AAC.1
MKVSEGFEKYYADGVVLLLLKAIYGTKQAAMVFWRELLKCMEDMKYKCNCADLCVYFKWTLVGLVIWLSWIDNCMVWGPEGIVKAKSDAFNERFDCDDGGEVTEYVGCKIEREDGGNSFKFTQTVLVQSYEHEYELSGRKPNTPAETSMILEHATDDEKVNGTMWHWETTECK